MVSFRQQCISLRNKGFTLDQIIAKTNRPKTSVYFHIRDIALSDGRKKHIRDASIKRLKKFGRIFSQSIKGKSRLNRHPIPFKRWDNKSVSLISHLLFDGEIKRFGCVYTNRCLKLHEKICFSMKRIYPFPCKRYESLPGVYKTAFFNVELGSYLTAKSGDLLNNIRRMDRELQRTFLQAFFDDEGSVYFIGKRRAVRGYQHNLKILYLVRGLLKNFGIESKVDEKYSEIYISKRKNLVEFRREINFSPGMCVNGERSNSTWGKSLEKRLILKNALASYRKL